MMNLIEFNNRLFINSTIIGHLMNHFRQNVKTRAEVSYSPKTKPTRSATNVPLLHSKPQF